MEKEKFKLPKNLSPTAKSFINNVIAELKEKGILENIDNAALYMLAVDYEQFLQATDRVNKEGLTVTSDRGNLAVHPCVKIAKDAEKGAVEIMKQFGLTAASRKKLTSLYNDEISPFEAFINGDDDE